MEHFRQCMFAAASKSLIVFLVLSLRSNTHNCPCSSFQYKKVKITAEDWYENTKDLFTDPKEIIYIATDEKDRRFFEPLAKHYNLRFLDDFKNVAKLDDIDPNLFGMIDTVIASRGRLFVGTWFSTFTGYINRMRGYNGMPGTTSYYSSPDRKFNTHKWVDPEKILIAREWVRPWRIVLIFTCITVLPEITNLCFTIFVHAANRMGRNRWRCCCSFRDRYVNLCIKTIKFATNSFSLSIPTPSSHDTPVMQLLVWQQLQQA